MIFLVGEVMWVQMGVKQECQLLVELSLGFSDVIHPEVLRLPPRSYSMGGEGVLTQPSGIQYVRIGGGSNLMAVLL